MKPKMHAPQLDSLDAMQILDRLESRAEAYERTGVYMESKQLVDTIVEEIRDSEEAQAMAAPFR